MSLHYHPVVEGRLGPMCNPLLMASFVVQLFVGIVWMKFGELGVASSYHVQTNVSKRRYFLRC